MSLFGGAGSGAPNHVGPNYGPPPPVFSSAVPAGDFHRRPRIVTKLQEHVNNPELSDVTFQVEGQLVYAHESILVMTSDYFHQLLRNGMRESNNNDGSPIVIEDTSHATFVKVIEYLYTDSSKCESIEEYRDLLIASDMYLLDDLKIACQVALGQRLTSDTAVSILILSHERNAEVLKKRALDFISSSKVRGDTVVLQAINTIDDTSLLLEIVGHDWTTARSWGAY